MLTQLARRWDRVRKDARMVLSGFAGTAPSVFVVPVKRRRPLPGRGVQVVEARAETRDTTTLVLADPNGGALGFVAGQFFTVVLSIDGQVVRRAYSASSDPSDTDRVAITVKRVPGGKGSNAVTALGAGDTLRIIGPSGSFTLPDGQGDVCFVAGGSGITPIMAILRSLARPGAPRRRLSLVYGNRSPEDVIFARELDAFVASGLLRVHHVLESRALPDGASQGILDERNLRAAFAALDVDTTRAHFMASGPAAAVASVERALEALRVSRSRVFVERFASVEERPVAPLPLRATATFLVDGASRPVEVPRGETLLDAARRQGVDAPFSCTMGGCGACKLRVVRGEVTMDEPNCLLPDERSAGFVLGCVGRPLGDCTVEVPA